MAVRSGKALMCKQERTKQCFRLRRHGRSTTGQLWTLTSASRQTTCNGCDSHWQLGSRACSDSLGKVLIGGGTCRRTWQAFSIVFSNSQQLPMLPSMISCHGLCYQCCQPPSHSLLSSHRVLDTIGYCMVAATFSPVT